MAASSDVLELAALEAELATRRLSEFIRQAWSLVEPSQPYVPGWHIDAIALHLEAVTRGEIQNLLITMPPRHMKSLAVSVFWPAWVWTSQPSWRGVFTSYSLQLAIRDSVKCRRLIESPWYRRRWGHRFTLTGDQNVKGRFENSARGERLTGSVDGGVTGEGGDVIVCDDPHNVREATSDAYRQAVIDWWDQVIPTRLNNPKTGGRVIVMQRVHDQDLAGHWLGKGDNVVHLNLPAEFEEARRCVTPFWSDPRQSEGELLWPARFDADALAHLKRDLGSYGAAGQLQQRPSPAEGGLIKRAWFQWYRDRPTRLDELVISVDPALRSQQTNDYSAVQVWGRAAASTFAVLMKQERWALPDLVREVRGVHAWVQQLWPSTPIVTLIENAGAGPEAIAELRRVIPGVVAEHPKGDKRQRVHAVLPILEGQNVWLPGVAFPDGRVDGTLSPAWVDPFVEECAAFPFAAHDDQVDAMTQALRRLHRPKHRFGFTDLQGL